jgi:hypothetical protein
LRPFLLHGLRAMQGAWAPVRLGWNPKRLFAIKG